jgi:hypothetical protein
MDQGQEDFEQVANMPTTNADAVLLFQLLVNLGLGLSSSQAPLADED